MTISTLRKLLFLGSSLLTLQAGIASAQVVDWYMYKERLFFQAANNTSPAAPGEYWAGAVVETQNPGDAAALTVSGGGLPGSLPLTFIDGHWELEADFVSLAQMNAVVPSTGTYTLTLSGGTLGTLMQTVTFGAAQYPNTPYLTGTTWTGVQAYSAAAPYTITWSNPGPLTLASGLTLFDITGSVQTVFSQQTPGGAISGTVPAGTLGPTQIYEGYLSFTNTVALPSGGFGIPGASHHVNSQEFVVRTLTTSYCTGGTTSSGCVASLSASGLPSASAGSGFTVTAINVEGNKDGLFFVGTSGRQANSWGNGTSFQCVVPPVKRFGLLPTNGSNGSCNGTKSQDFNSYWFSTPSKNPGVGAVVQAQLWYRDPQNTSNQTTSLSNAIEFTVNP